MTRSRLKVAQNTSVATVLAVYLFLGNQAIAQEDETIGVGEIVVTAERRSENLQDIPLAITVFGADAIDKSRITNLEDIATRTPSFVIGQQSPSDPELTIRGIGSTDREAGSDRSVVVFVDEVYVGRSGGSTLDFFDLERIEVLRGPQGTLYGRNVVGGAINVITAKPSSEQYAKFQLGVGNYGLIEGKGVFNQPLSDRVFSKLSFNFKKRNGTAFNDVFNRDADGYTNATIRGQLKYEPSAETTVLLSAEYNNDQVDGVSSKPDPVGGALAAVGGLQTLSADPRIVSNNLLGFLDREIYGGYVRIDHDTSFATITSLTSYRDVNFRFERDIAGVPLRGGTPGQRLGFKSAPINREHSKTFSQELRLASLPNDGPLQWTLGLYYLNEDIELDQIRERELRLPPAADSSVVRATVSRPLFDQDVSAKSYAAFGQATYTVAEALSFTVGARVTRDEKGFNLQVVNTDPANTNSLNPATAVFSANAKQGWTSFTPKFTIDYKAADDVLFYGTVSRGFKSGGFTGIADNAVAARVPFAPETVWNYEVGTKLRFANDRLQINLAGFYLDFRDLQLRQRILTVPGDPASAVVVIFNAAKATIKGLEAEVIAVPFRGLTLNAGYSYLDTEITGSTNPTLAGTGLPRAPEHSFSGSAEYEFPVGDAGDISLSATVRHTGEHFFDLGRLAAGIERPYTLVDGRIAFDSADKIWTVAVWGKNVFDKLYRSHVQSVSAGAGGIARYGDPATYGVSVTMRFN